MLVPRAMIIVAVVRDFTSNHNSEYFGEMTWKKGCENPPRNYKT